MTRPEPPLALPAAGSPATAAPTAPRPGPGGRFRRARRWLAAATILAGLSGLAAAGWRLYARAQAVAKLPSAPARRGEFLAIVRCRGELRARRSAQVTAPVNVPELRILWLAPAGEPVTEGQVVIRFDPSSARQQLKEKQATIEQAQATLDQAEAQSRITAEQDRLDLAQARYQVERAKLEASKAEIVSRLQGEESRIELGLAQQKLRVQEATLSLHEASSKARIASVTRVRDQARAEVELTQRRLSQMELKAPINGVIVYLSNHSQGWMNAKPFKVGDQAWPGAALAEIPDLSTLQMEAKLEEIDRGRLSAGSAARVRVDSLPELSLPAKLAAISPLTQQSYEWPPTRSFRGYAPVETPDQRLRPGMNGSLDIVVNRFADAISIPSQAVFTRRGKPIVYLAEKGAYRAAEVEVLARNPDEVAIKGIPAGAMVALAEPEGEGKRR